MGNEVIKLDIASIENTARELRAGQFVLLSGDIYTARDKAHGIIAGLIAENKPLPFGLSGTAVYYCGAAPAKPGEVIGSCGPTSSVRMDKYTPALLERGLKAMIGKGNRGPGVTGAMKKYGAVYFAAVGGAAVYYKQFITAADLVAYPELLSEAVYRLTVKDFPVIVAIDSAGNSVFGR